MWTKTTSYTSYRSEIDDIVINNNAIGIKNIFKIPSTPANLPLIKVIIIFTFLAYMYILYAKHKSIIQNIKLTVIASAPLIWLKR